MNNPRVCIVILNWNKLELTKSCLESVQKQTYKNYHVIVVDNGSYDDSVSWLSNNSIETIINSKNLGFAKAINQGFKKAVDLNYPYVVSLNNDAEIDKNWLKILVNYMENNPKVSFAQGASMQKNSPKKFDSSGIYLERGFIPNQRALGKTVPDLEIPAIGPNAAGSIYRKELLVNLQIRDGEYFDNRFFAYVEDVDFNLRATLRGYKFSFVPSAKLFHIGSATGNSIAKKKMYWGSRNLVWLVVKNAPLPILRKSGKMIIRSHVANLQYLWKEQRFNFNSYLLGLIVGLLLSPLFIRQRHRNLKKQKITNNDFYELLVPANPPLNNPLKKLLNLVK